MQVRILHNPGSFVNSHSCFSQQTVEESLSKSQKELLANDAFEFMTEMLYLVDGALNLSMHYDKEGNNI